MYDIQFLHGVAQPTIVLLHQVQCTWYTPTFFTLHPSEILFHEQDIHGRHLKTHELSLKEKEFVKVTGFKASSIPGLTSCLITGGLEAR